MSNKKEKFSSFWQSFLLLSFWLLQQACIFIALKQKTGKSVKPWMCCQGSPAPICRSQTAKKRSCRGKNGIRKSKNERGEKK